MEAVERVETFDHQHHCILLTSIAAGALQHVLAENRHSSLPPGPNFQPDAQPAVARVVGFHHLALRAGVTGWKLLSESRLSITSITAYCSLRLPPVPFSM
jgi:hypothetical protein